MNQQNSVKTTSIEADLAHLINVSGKLRMLSHQIVMCALLHLSDPKGQGFLTKLSAALKEFEKITAQLLSPCAATGLSDETGEVLKRNSAISVEQQRVLSAFISRAKDLQHRLDHRQAAKLGEFVAGELLAVLNQINEAIRDTLDQQIAQKQAEKEPLLIAATHSVDEINRLSKTLQIVAMNASLEAQRAGSFGAAFGQIAKEMRDLSVKSLAQAKGLENDLGAFQGDKKTVTGRPVR